MNDVEAMSLSKEAFNQQKIEARDVVREKAIATLQTLNPVALHQFGSGGRGEGDAFSDVDLFLTLDDEKFDSSVAGRINTYTSIAPVLLRLFNKVPNPAGWYHDLIIHDTPSGLVHVDYYMTPRSKVILPPNAKLISGEDGLLSGEWNLPPETNASGHDLLDGILAMSYIGVKGVVRGWDSGFFDFLRGLYTAYQRDEDSNMPDLPPLNNHQLIQVILGNLERAGNENQIRANSKILEYAKQVAELYPSP
jgi:predicted nucleotidyltransferase